MEAVTISIGCNIAGNQQKGYNAHQIQRYCHDVELPRWQTRVRGQNFQITQLGIDSRFLKMIAVQVEKRKNTNYKQNTKQLLCSIYGVRDSNQDLTREYLFQVRSTKFLIFYFSVNFV